jgi:short-subunit dehydrogenase
MKITNKIIWITGASSGIGKALAIHLSKAKSNQLILSARRESALNKIKNLCAYPNNIVILPFDLAEIALMPEIAKNAIKAFGKVDILVNNGGISQRSLIIDTSIEVDKKLMEVDYLGTVALSKAILPYFIEKQSGHFVVVSSLMGKFSSPYRSGYCGAKHALHGFFDALRMEHEKDGIHVTLICPGFVNTDVARNALTGSGESQNSQDNATEKGLSTEIFTQRMTRAIANKKFEVYIGRKEVLGVYLKRFFPKFLHYYVLKNTVR